MPDDRHPPVFYRDVALADGRSPEPRLGVSILVRGRRIAWLGPVDAEPDVSGLPGLETVDASGATAVPAMVDAHSHVTLPGGAHWIDRGFDPPERLLLAAERNGDLLTRSGVRWARDVGAPVGIDPSDERRRALSLGLRDRWRARSDRPYIRAAGTWVTRAGTLPRGLGEEAADADQLLAAAVRQLDDGADLVKLYLDGPETGVSPWSRDEIDRVVAAAHARGARVTAHATSLAGARAGVEGGVDAIEHGFEIDRDLAAEMAGRGTFLVSTLSVFRSRVTFRRTTAIPRFASEDGARRIAERYEQASTSVAVAHAGGVPIAAGTDFGGGSPRAGELAWEVESLTATGLEPWEALGAATWRGGELLGEPEAGVVREGGPADFFLVHGDPLSEPSALWRVWRVAWET
jgi:imidazolonepropionase-like amidohydrolase